MCLDLHIWTLLPGHTLASLHLRIWNLAGFLHISLTDKNLIPAPFHLKWPLPCHSSSGSKSPYLSCGCALGNHSSQQLQETPRFTLKEGDSLWMEGKAATPSGIQMKAPAAPVLTTVFNFQWARQEVDDRGKGWLGKVISGLLKL